ncbi:MAG TPA: cytochrome P450 [Acidimicrobiales bacterium]|nr:cytochrome P450 [Acidimicrobiales bacterium]
MEPREVLTLDQINLSDLEFWTMPWEEREGAFQTLRRERPLAHFDDPELPPEMAFLVTDLGKGYRAMTKHAHIAEASRHPEIFQSGQGATSMIDLPEEMLEFFGSMINMDNPRHARLRRIVSAAFNPRMIKSIEATIEARAGDVIDRVSELGGCDFVVEVAARLPLEIICDMMGIAPADYDTVFNASNVILSSGDPEYIPEGADAMLAFMTAAQQLNLLMTDLAEFRRTNPTDDVTSALVNTNVDGEALTASEIASFFILLVVAGNETTRNAISHGLLALTQNPDQRALWQADPAGIAATGVDEIVRWGTPVIWMRRTVAQDTVLGDDELKEGERVILFYNSANRDEDVFENPYTFDVRRNPNPHIGFGAAGPHFCLGAHLARQEIDVMFRQLFERLPDIASVGEPDRLRSSFINGIKHLDCEFTPVAAQR